MKDVNAMVADAFQAGHDAATKAGDRRMFNALGLIEIKPESLSRADMRRMANSVGIPNDYAFLVRVHPSQQKAVEEMAGFLPAGKARDQVKVIAAAWPECFGSMERFVFMTAADGIGHDSGCARQMDAAG